MKTLNPEERGEKKMKIEKKRRERRQKSPRKEKRENRIIHLLGIEPLQVKVMHPTFILV